MIEFGTLTVDDERSLAAARQKVRALAGDLGLSAIMAVRLATITSELCRDVLRNRSPVRLTARLSTRKDRHGLTLVFSWRGKPLSLIKAKPFFDELVTPSVVDEARCVVGTCFLGDAALAPTRDLTDFLSKRFLQLSREELVCALTLKNEELHKQTVTLERATELKSEFLANMSHELRTPLNSIIGFTARVIRKCGEILPKRQLKNLQTVFRNAHHLLGLINSLLDISKIEAGKMDVFCEEFTVAPLMLEVVDLVQPLVGNKGIKLVTNVPKEDPTLYSDKAKLKQILINLVTNAIKFTETGRVTLSVHSVDPSLATTDLFYRPDTDYLTISVTDTGIGITPEEQQAIFEAFRQVDGGLTRKAGGTGLGLALAKRFVEMLRGRISLESELGQGSTFRVTLPIRMSYALTAPKERSELEPVSAIDGRATILCIDDDPEVLELLQGYLVDEGYNVTTATSGAEGLEKAMALELSAITLDIQMPGMDGWTVLSKLKSHEKTRKIPVIIVSIMENKSLGFGLGAFDYLTKPILPRDLLSSIGRLGLADVATVLVIDDDPMVCDLIHEILSEENFQIRMANNGVEALADLEKHRPDLILLDLMMPEMDGFEVARRVRMRSEWASIPIIVITAKLLTAQEREYLSTRVETIVAKEGMQTDAILKEIHHVIRRRR